MNKELLKFLLVYAMLFMSYVTNWLIKLYG